MNTTNIKQLLRHARQLWNVDYVPPEINRRNRHQWVRAVNRLGDRWLLAKQVSRLTTV